MIGADWWGPYVGIPFCAEGRAGLTCWGLVRRVYADRLGIDLPEYGEISGRDLGRIARAMRDGPVRDGWARVSGAPAVFDVVGMRGPMGGQAIVHVGVMVDGARLLHVEESTAAVVVPVAHWAVRSRIAGFFRWNGGVSE